jgi:GGDEF domain-containing protein
VPAVTRPDPLGPVALGYLGDHRFDPAPLSHQPAWPALSFPFLGLVRGQQTQPLLAERVRQRVEFESLTEDESPLGRSITVSVGVAVLTEDVSSLDELLETADDELYRAKRAGKNQVAAVGRG